MENNISGIEKVYENLITELVNLKANNAPVETIDAIRFAAQVCANVAMNEAEGLNKEQRAFFGRHLQYR